MGWIKDAKAEAISKEAQRAIDEGRTVFVCRVNQGALQSNFSGSLSGVAEQIEAIEAVGWQLDQASFSHDHKDHASAFLIFRRPKAAAPSVQRQATWGGQ
ncbi:hypothetical protein BG418_20290 [Streptomyces sp. CBMA152]|nr:hypothetical protein [Streptomyces sp. CBMA152]